VKAESLRKHSDSRVAPSLGLLLLFRVLQGAFGGGLQPMTQAILADTFPPEKRGLAFALYGITVICGPAIGPTLGGWITDNYSWRWIFYINVPVGILAVLLVSQLIEDPPYLSRLKATLARFDYIGFALLAVGVGALQVAYQKAKDAAPPSPLRGLFENQIQLVSTKPLDSVPPMRDPSVE
jgi:MFS transporter, DHA2 family, multidrug resistance protein